MSAWYCNDDHLAYLMAAAIELNRRSGSHVPFGWNGPDGNGPDGNGRQLTRMTFRETGQMLRDANLLNLRYMYGGELDREDERGLRIVPEDTAFRPAWFRVEAHSIQPVEVLASLHCYRYQCSDGDNWKGSEAEAFINELNDSACHQLEGYDRAPWGMPEHLRGRIAVMETDHRENDHRENGWDSRGEGAALREPEYPEADQDYVLSSTTTDDIADLYESARDSLSEGTRIPEWDSLPGHEKARIVQACEHINSSDGDRLQEVITQHWTVQDEEMEE